MGRNARYHRWEAIDVKKRILSLILTAVLTAGILCALTLPARAWEEDSAEIDGRRIYAVKTTGYLLVVGQDHILWAYDARNGWAAQEVMRDVQMISLYDERGVVLNVFALKTDGTVWHTQDGTWDFDRGYDGLLTQPVQVMSGVKDISDSRVLTSDGAVLQLQRSGSGWEALPTGETGVESFRQLTIRIILERNRERWTDSMPREDEIATCPDDNFILTKGGELWSWGWSNYGSLGRGADYDWDATMYTGEDKWMVASLEYYYPEVMLTEVTACWGGVNSQMFALRRDGTVWTWGDGEPAMSHGVDYYSVEVTLPEDLTGWTPRQISDTFSYRDLYLSFDSLCLRFYRDGRLILNPERENVRLNDWLAAPSNETPFADVDPGAYYYGAVKWALDAGVTTGIAADAFGPEDSVTRAQAATFLWRAMGKPRPGTEENPFADVPADAYYRDAVLWAVERGITKGTDDEHFSPDQTCSTAHILTFLYRALGLGTDGWYAEAGEWAQGEGLLTGTGARGEPGEDCPRASVVTFLYRALA